jgi:hypothetical protein
MRWEYKAHVLQAMREHPGQVSGTQLHPGRLESELNQLGEQGWELVGVESWTGPGRLALSVALLKRPRA